MRAFLGCDIGKKREENQDSIRADLFEDGVLALVCDGMGGMQNGSAASKIAVSAAEEQFRARYVSGMRPKDICAILRDCASYANQKVYTTATRAEMPVRMGSTLVAAFARDDAACIVNVGDSRAYLLPQDGRLRQLTTDHTVVQLLYEQGAIRAEERATHRRRNELTRAIGVTARVLADTQVLPLEPCDSLLLCSDGLYGMVPESRIAAVIRSNPPQRVPEVLIAEANAAGGKDNISVILLTA